MFFGFSTLLMAHGTDHIRKQYLEGGCVYACVCAFEVDPYPHNLFSLLFRDASCSSVGWQREPPPPPPQRRTPHPCPSLPPSSTPSPTKKVGETWTEDKRGKDAVRVCVCVCARVLCVCVCVRALARGRARLCVCVCVNFTIQSFKPPPPLPSKLCWEGGGGGGV